MLTLLEEGNLNIDVHDTRIRGTVAMLSKSNKKTGPARHLFKQLQVRILEQLVVRYGFSLDELDHQRLTLYHAIEEGSEPLVRLWTSHASPFSEELRPRGYAASLLYAMGKHQEGCAKLCWAWFPPQGKLLQEALTFLVLRTVPFFEPSYCWMPLFIQQLHQDSDPSFKLPQATSFLLSFIASSPEADPTCQFQWLTSWVHAMMTSPLTVEEQAAVRNLFQKHPIGSQVWAHGWAEQERETLDKLV